MDYSDPNQIMDDMQIGKGVANNNAGTNTQQSPPAFVPSNAEYVLAGFWLRFLAALVDGIILGIGGQIIMLPLTFMNQLMINQYGPMSAAFFIGTGVNWITSLALAGSYYGWFYSKKGASPGKMLLKLRVVNADNGQNVLFWTGFLRDSLGKLISSVTLLIGYVMAAFRSDHKALHDIMFGTQVLQRIK